MGCGASAQHYEHDLAAEPCEPQPEGPEAPVIDISSSSSMPEVIVVGEEPVQSCPRPQSTRPCRDFVAGSCRHGANCRYSHDLEAQQQRAERYGRIPCRYYAQGYCRHGDQCWYSHEETREEDMTRGQVEREELLYDDAIRLLQEAQEQLDSCVPTLEEQCAALSAEVDAMDVAERTEAGKTQWQYSGRKRERYYDYPEENNQSIEDAYQDWIQNGRSRKPEDRRFNVTVQTGPRSFDICIDFQLFTQRNSGGGIRGIRRAEPLPKALALCKEYFTSAMSATSDMCGTLEHVGGCFASMDLTDEDARTLKTQEMECVNALSPLINDFLKLALLCPAREEMEKLAAVLGERNAGLLGVAASGREMHFQQVCKTLVSALGTCAYAQPLEEGESAWTRIQPLISDRRFFGHSMVQFREVLVKQWQRHLRITQRHAFMLAATHLNEISEEDPEFFQSCKEKIADIVSDGLKVATTGSGSFQALTTILTNAKMMQLENYGEDELVEWFSGRLRCAILSAQPVEWVAEILKTVKDMPGVDITEIAEPLLELLVSKCADGIVKGEVPPEKVNQVAIFASVLGSPFNEQLFEALSPSYDDEDLRESISEWLVAYCEHTGAELPPFCMNADQVEAHARLQEAIASGDLAEVKAAVIAAKLVPDVKDHEELFAVYSRALEILKEASTLPPGWDLEDLLGTEKLFKKKPIEEEDQLYLFQILMSATHQKRWTRDRAVRGDGAPIADSFQVTRVIEIQNEASWENYDRRRQEIVTACCPEDGEPCAPVPEATWKAWSGPIMTGSLGEQIAESCQLSPLEERCNEFLLFHGCKPHVADLIAENHFDISFASKDGMFGAGLYFAEASSKSDEYSKSDDDGEFPLIIVRVILGRPNYVDTPKPFDNPGRRNLEQSCMSGSYHSVIGDRIKTSNTYRELVVYDHFQAYPHFIVWYRRV